MLIIAFFSFFSVENIYFKHCEGCHFPTSDVCCVCLETNIHGMSSKQCQKLNLDAFSRIDINLIKDVSSRNVFKDKEFEQCGGVCTSCITSQLKIEVVTVKTTNVVKATSSADSDISQVTASVVAPVQVTTAQASNIKSTSGVIEIDVNSTSKEIEANASSNKGVIDIDTDPSESTINTEKLIGYEDRPESTKIDSALVGKVAKMPEAFIKANFSEDRVINIFKKNKSILFQYIEFGGAQGLKFHVVFKHRSDIFVSKLNITYFVTPDLIQVNLYSQSLMNYSNGIVQ